MKKNTPIRVLALLWPFRQRLAVSNRLSVACQPYEKKSNRRNNTHKILINNILLTTKLFNGFLCEAHARGPAGGAAAPVASGVIAQDSINRYTILIDEVEINTGYQRIPKERATGSFVFVDSALLNRTFSTDVLSRLEGVVPGLRFNRDVNDPDRVDLTLRGPSTVRAANQPLIILNNFEYQGELININPNDIANITVLKDAAGVPRRATGSSSSRPRTGGTTCRPRYSSPATSLSGSDRMCSVPPGWVPRMSSTWSKNCIARDFTRLHSPTPPSRPYHRWRGCWSGNVPASFPNNR